MSQYTAISLKMDLELVSNLQNGGISCTNTGPNFSCIIPKGFQKNNRKCNLECAATSLMTSQILKVVDLSKTRKSQCLDSEILFSLQIKKSFNTH